MEHSPIISAEYAKHLSDEALADLLMSSGDTLPRCVVDECVARREAMIDPLWDIISEDNYWQCDDERWWAPVHATFILGEIGGKEVITPLIMSMRFADAYDCDWLTETLPSIFGSIGPAVLEPLKAVVRDGSNNWMTRTIALEGMAAVTIQQPQFRREIFDFVASILNDVTEARELRGVAGSTLIDFRQKTYIKSIIAYGEEEDEIQSDDPSYIPMYGGESIGQKLQSEIPDLWQYTKNCLEFYDPKEIAARQKRWKHENSPWYWLLRKWDLWKLRWELRKIGKDD